MSCPRCEVIHADRWVGRSSYVEQENVVQFYVVLKQHQLDVFENVHVTFDCPQYLRINYVLFEAFSQKLFCVVSVVTED